MISGNEQFERDFEAFLKEDDSRLAALYRKLPQAEPDAKLDAAVLAMAHRTLNPHLVATPLASAAARRRARWLAPLGVAAGLVLAAGVAFRTGPQIWGDHGSPPSAAAKDEGVVEVRPIDAAAPPPPASPPPPAESAAAAPASVATMQASAAMKAKAPPAPARELAAEQARKPAPEAAPVIAADRTEFDAKELKKAENTPPQATAPQPFPGQVRREPQMDAVERKQAIATGAWQKLHEQEISGGAAAGTVSANATSPRDAPKTAVPAAALAAPVPEPAMRAKTMAAPAASTVPMTTQSDSAAASDQIKRGDMQQPAAVARLTRNSHLYPESWIVAIQRLIHDGQREEALQNLQLFREKYPNYHLPADLEHLPAPKK